MLIQGNIESKVSEKFKRVFLDELAEQIEVGLAVSLQSHLIPNLNQLFVKSQGYMEVFPNIMFDTSVTAAPIVEKHFVGMGMNGLFSLKNHSDFDPKELEREGRNYSDLHPLTPQFDRNGSKMQFHLHQMSLNSAL